MCKPKPPTVCPEVSVVPILNPLRTLGVAVLGSVGSEDKYPGTSAVVRLAPEYELLSCL